jgi:non-specific serine/threonine protein kinase
VDHPIGVLQLTHPDLEEAFPPLRGLAETPHNLPSQLTSFVGRDRELAEIVDLVGRSRLVTLTGAGGSGKTRLALQFAVGALDEYPDGVWFVDLAVVDDPALVPGVVALTVGVPEAPGRSIVDRLVERLEHRETLLVLDNCEHVLVEAASLVVEVLKRTEAVRVVATSRQALGVAGEHLYVVPTLVVPDERVTDPTVLKDYAAVRLFADRAETAQPDFGITASNATAVTQICRRLDGLPLALELAAARLTILTPEELQQRLDDRFTILTGGTRDQLAHHQTLAATLDWSYQLLTSAERALFDRVSIFVGGFTLDAAEQVCSGDGVDPGSVVDLVAGLVDKSLLVSFQKGASRRFRSLETVREFAAARLSDIGETERLAERHAAYFQRLAVDSHDQVWGPDEAEWLDRLDEEWPNLRRSLQWHLDKGHAQDGQMMAGSLRTFYPRRYHETEGIEWLRRFVAADPTPSPGRARAVHALALYADEPEMLGQAIRLWDEAIDLCRRYLPKRELATALYNAFLNAINRGDWETGRALASEQLLISRATDEPIARYLALSNAAGMAEFDNDPIRFLTLQEEALDWAQQSGSPQMVVYAWRGVGLAQRLAGDLDGAAAALLEAQRLEADLGDKRGFAGWTERSLAAVALDRADTKAAVAHLLEFNDATRQVKDDSHQWRGRAKPLLEWARIAIARGQYEAAVILLGAADSFYEEFVWYESQLPSYHADSQQTLDAARNHLDPKRYETAWARGRGITSSEALDYAFDHLATGSA